MFICKDPKSLLLLVNHSIFWVINLTCQSLLCIKLLKMYVCYLCHLWAWLIIYKTQSWYAMAYEYLTLLSAIFISIKSWLSIILVEETGVLIKTTDLLYVIARLNHIMLYQVHLVICRYWIYTFNGHRF